MDFNNGVGLVLSGGGAKGSYEAGVIKALVEAGIKFDVVAGTSVGALNAALLVAGKIDEMVKIWENIRRKDVFSMDGWTIFQRGSLLNNKPLQNLIEREIDEKTARRIIESACKLIIVSSCLQDKAEIIDKDFQTREQIIQALLSSSAIPAAFPFQILASLKNKGDKIDSSQTDKRQLVDGGIINNFPLPEAIATGLCKTIITVPLYTAELKKPIIQKTWYQDLLHVGLRAVDIVFSSDYQRDMREIREKIELVDSLKGILETKALFFPSKVIKQKIGDILERYGNYNGLKIIEICPQGDLPINMLDFVPRKTKEAVKMGYEDAQKIIKSL